MLKHQNQNIKKQASWQQRKNQQTNINTAPDQWKDIDKQVQIKENMYVAPDHIMIHYFNSCISISLHLLAIIKIQKENLHKKNKIEKKQKSDDNKRFTNCTMHDK